MKKKGINMITEQEMKTRDITHRHGGNSFAVCQKIDDDYVRLTPVMANPFGQCAYLAATSLLSVSPHPKKLKDEIIDKLAELRKKIESGKLKIVNQRIVEA